MSSLYAAMVIAVVVTMLLATRVLMLRASRSPIEGLLARLRFDVDWLSRAAKDCIDDWIAATIADRERKAANALPLAFNDDQSGDASLEHRGIDDDVGCCEHGSVCRPADRPGDGAAGKVGR